MLGPFNTPGVYTGDCRELMSQLPERCIQTCVTSPPYWGLRDYGVDGQLGLEDTPEQYVEVMVDVCRAIHRVLRTDGTLWLNLGDTYSQGGRGATVGTIAANNQRESRRALKKMGGRIRGRPKNLLGLPWRVALALQDDGWYLRLDIIWEKPTHE